MAKQYVSSPSTLDRFRAQLSGTPGKVGAVVFCLLALGLAVYLVRSFLKGDMPDDAYYTTYIDTETGKVFRHRNELGESLPIESPDTGKKTGMPAEACYWTKDGKPKDTPTWVLLNEELGKHGPTFCPDCGRLVVGHNPRPGPGMKPPATQAQYAAAHARQNAADARASD